MGISVWLVAGAGATLLARFVPFLRGRVLMELLLALASAMILGALATLLDFGGWNEPDWRAGVFALLGSFAVVGCGRLVRT